MDDDDTDEELNDLEEEGEPERDRVEEPPERREPAGPQDDPDVVANLESFGARVERNHDGWVWRVFLYEKGGCDEALEFVKKLPEVRELWTIYSKVTPQAVAELKKEMPELTIFS